MTLEEKERNGNFKLSWMSSRLIPILILLTTLMLTYYTYDSSYCIKEDTTDLAAAIRDYIPNQKVKAEVNLIQSEDNWMYVIFSDSQYGECFMGMVLLKRGWNGKYVIRSAEYGSGPPIRLTVKPDNKSQVIIYGSIKDRRAVRYEYAKSIQDIYYEVMYKGNIDQETFFQVQENKDFWWTGFRLFDAQGMDITDSYLSKQFKNAPAGSVNSAEIFMIDIKCLIILLLGIGLAVGMRNRRRSTKS